VVAVLGGSTSFNAAASEALLVQGEEAADQAISELATTGIIASGDVMVPEVIQDEEGAAEAIIELAQSWGLGGTTTTL
jgi:hypothetical protein